MRSIWFTSDFHLGHFNIIRYCNRPFANVQAMDDAIVDGVNACVKPNDVLYFLGDFCLGRAEQVVAYRPTLYLKIENPPFMALVIEATPEPGPTGLPAISIAHYGEQNCDLMRDPEMCFELVKSPQDELGLSSFYFRNDYLGVEQYSRYASEQDCIVLSDLQREHEHFARMWDRNIHAQGFLEAFNDKSIRG